MHGLADALKVGYLNPRLAMLGVQYQESWSRDGDSLEFSWEVAIPWNQKRAAPTGPAALVHLSVTQTKIAIAFEGLDQNDLTGVNLCRRTADDIEVLVDSYLTRAKMTDLYFVFSTGGARTERDAPSSSGGMGREAARRIIAGNMLNLYLIIMAASFVFFLFLGDDAIFAVLGLQLLALFFSDRLALGVGKVRPSRDRPDVTIVSVPVTTAAKETIASDSKIVPETMKLLEGALSAGAKDEATIRSSVQTILAGSPLGTAPDDVRLVKRDVYGLVENVADRFGLPVPKIVIMNSTADNAAATGVSPGRASITITAGSLEDLDDSELSSVVGHEMGHIKGRDSLILFSVTFLLFIGGLYIWFPILLLLGSLAIFYYLFVFAVIYGVGKVLETRADTESVVKLGQPGVLASALTNIGFRQLYYERYSSGSRLADWLKFDPHPPIYFRVQRLSRFASMGSTVRHTFLVSIRDCTSGFLRALIGI
jgi:heat shock protein HtpX